MAKEITLKIVSVMEKGTEIHLRCVDSKGNTHVLDFVDNPERLDEEEIIERINDKLRELNGVNRLDYLVGKEIAL